MTLDAFPRCRDPVLQREAGYPLDRHLSEAPTDSQDASSRRPALQPVEAMLLALSRSPRRQSVLPHVHLTLPQAEIIHRALVARVGRGRRVNCPELTGHDTRGRPLMDGHRHAHILPLDLDADEHLDHVLIWAPMRLGEVAQRAIRSLRRTWTQDGKGDLQVAWVGRGDRPALAHFPEALRRRTQRLLAVDRYDGGMRGHGITGATTWVSLTPFVPPRFVKRRGRNTLEGQVLAELACRGLPPAVRIEVLSERSRRLRHFVRVRRYGGSPPPVDVGYALRLAWETPILGPVVLGYGCHFGLGLFIADT